MRLGNLNNILETMDKPEGAVGFIIATSEFYIPVGDKLDVEAELSRLTNELEYNLGFLKSVMSKLENKRFVDNAPEKVVEIERKKEADARANIKSLEKRIAELKG